MSIFGSELIPTGKYVAHHPEAGRPFREDEVNTAIDELLKETLAHMKDQSQKLEDVRREYALFKIDQINVVADLKAENAALREALLLCNSQQPSASATPKL